MSKINGMVAVLAVVGLLGGCATASADRVVVCKIPGQAAARTGPALVGKGYGVEMSPIPLDSIQFTDSGLWEQVAVQHLSAARTATNGVEVTARFINCTDAPLVLSVRTSFMDERQAPTEAVSAWQKVYAQPRSTAIYTEISLPNPRINYYLVEVSKTP